MYAEFPEIVDPFRLAERDAELQGRIAPSTLERLGTMLAGTNGWIDVRVHFGRHAEVRAMLEGEAVAEVELLCQRCMRPFMYRHTFEFRLGMVNDEEKAALLPDGFEPLVIQDEQLRIADVVEDELILGLPLVPMHEAPDCNRELLHWQEEDESRENPFSVLEGLKDKLERQ